MNRLGGGHIGKHQAEEVIVRLSQDFEAFYDQPLSPLPLDAEKKAKDHLLVISADGKGIVMHPGSLRGPTKAAAQAAEPKQETRLSPGEKRHRKRVATVLSVYEVEPQPRAAEQVLERQQNAQESR